jgi:hypothetical protein
MDGTCGTHGIMNNIKHFNRRNLGLDEKNIKMGLRGLKYESLHLIQLALHRIIRKILSIL